MKIIDCKGHTPSLLQRESNDLVRAFLKASITAYSSEIFIRSHQHHIRYPRGNCRPSLPRHVGPPERSIWTKYESCLTQDRQCVLLSLHINFSQVALSGFMLCNLTVYHFFSPVRYFSISFLLCQLHRNFCNEI